MWGALAKIGGLVLGSLGVDWAIGAYKENAAAQAQQEENIQVGKVFVGAAVLYLGYLLLKKVK